jgi:Fis family transcriptional regulator
MSSALAAKATDLEPEPDSDARQSLTVPQPNHTEPLRNCVRSALRFYLTNMGGHDVTGLYRMVLDEVERPMIETVLEHTNGNQSQAAQILGISRSTLRKKLKSTDDR